MIVQCFFIPLGDELENRFAVSSSIGVYHISSMIRILYLTKIIILDLSNGKASDDGYRGVHLYYQLNNHHYPIEIQYNTYYDRQINNWLHSFLYKKNYSDSVGLEMRKRYEVGKIKNEKDFKEELEDVLCHS